MQTVPAYLIVNICEVGTLLFHIFYLAAFGGGAYVPIIKLTYERASPPTPETILEELRTDLHVTVSVGVFLAQLNKTLYLGYAPPFPPDGLKGTSGGAVGVLVGMVYLP